MSKRGVGGRGKGERPDAMATLQVANEELEGQTDGHPDRTPAREEQGEPLEREKSQELKAEHHRSSLALTELKTKLHEERTRELVNHPGRRYYGNTRWS
ncbi:hypothetical protein KUCAC02_036194 [Chaenocephalus aceratus]|nr:hypothetical protein KUCAC02_036194 [Chaenocephalus aceratus]